MTNEDIKPTENANPVKTFPAPGLYHARLTVTDNEGNPATNLVPINVTTTFPLWQQARFTPAELTNAAISGPLADPDHDGVVNQLEYALGLDPKATNNAANGLPKAAITSGYFTLTFTRFKAAGDISLVAEVSTDLQTWNSGPGYTEQVQTIDNGAIETMTVRETAPIAVAGQGFMRLKILQAP